MGQWVAYERQTHPWIPDLQLMPSWHVVAGTVMAGVLFGVLLSQLNGAMRGMTVRTKVGLWVAAPLVGYGLIFVWAAVWGLWVEPWAVEPYRAFAQLNARLAYALYEGVFFGVWALGAAAVGGGMVYIVRLLKRTRDILAPPSTHRRGVVLLGGRAATRVRKFHAQARRRAIAQGGSPGTRLCGLNVSSDAQTKHFKMIGVTGSGKSTAIRGLLTDASNLGDRAVIADPDGGYLRKFYNPKRGDVILNPFDRRPAQWDILAELTAAFDPDQVARSLIADNPGHTGAEWVNYARTLLAVVLTKAKALKLPAADIHKLIAIESTETLAEFVRGTSASRYFEKGNERMLGSITSTAATAVKSLEYLQMAHGQMISIKQWIRSGRGWLFMPYRTDQIEAVRSLFGTWMRMAIFSTLSLPEGDARLWFVIDELDALGKIDGLADALARLRKFGGRCVLGFQSLGPLVTLYGPGFGAAITENCGNTLILRCGSSKDGGTSQFASELIGDREVERVVKSTSSHKGSSSGERGGSSSSGRGTSVSTQVVTEAAVMPSQIEQLPSHEGYLKIADQKPWVHLSFRHDDMPDVAEPFVEHAES